MAGSPSALSFSGTDGKQESERLNNYMIFFSEFLSHAKNVLICFTMKQHTVFHRFSTKLALILSKWLLSWVNQLIVSATNIYCSQQRDSRSAVGGVTVGSCGGKKNKTGVVDKSLMSGLVRRVGDGVWRPKSGWVTAAARCWQSWKQNFKQTKATLLRCSGSLWCIIHVKWSKHQQTSTPLPHVLDIQRNYNVHTRAHTGSRWIWLISTCIWLKHTHLQRT